MNVQETAGRTFSLPISSSAHSPAQSLANKFNVKRFLQLEAPEEPLRYFQYLCEYTSQLIRPSEGDVTLWDCLFNAEENKQVTWLEGQITKDKAILKKHEVINDEGDKQVVSPMLVLVWRGHSAALKVLLSNKIPIKRDAKKWTEVHWAALTGNPKLLSIFEKYNYKLASERLRNNWGSRPIDLLTFSHPPQVIHISVDGGHSSLTGPEYEEKLKHQYSPYSVWSPGAIVELRRVDPIRCTFKGLKQLDESLIKQAESLLSGTSPNWFQITPILAENYDANIAIKMQGQLEARAVRKIPSGTALCLYAGKVFCNGVDGMLSTNRMQMCLHRQLSSHVIDASKIGSGAEFINHGAPNCELRTVTIRGIPQRVYFALRTIHQGEALHIQYNSKFAQEMGADYVELGMSEIRHYVNETNGLINISAYTLENSSSHRIWRIREKDGMLGFDSFEIQENELTDYQVQCLYHRAMLSYIFHHPEALEGALQAGTKKEVLAALLHLFGSYDQLNLLCSEPDKVLEMLNNQP